MLFADYELVLDGVSSESVWTYTKNINVKDFRQIQIYVVEDNANNVMYKLEARSAQHTKAPWKEIMEATDLAQNADVVLSSQNLTGVTQVPLLEEAWCEIRIGIIDSGGTGRVYAWVNKRRR